jgi:predicted metal-dependent peptidase
VAKKKSCPNCESDFFEYIDVFNVGSLTDQHYEIEISADDLTKRLASAAEVAARLGAPTSLGVEEEVGHLVKPKLTWEDFIQSHYQKKQEELGRNDWASPRIRPLFAGLYIPKKKQIRLKTLILVDRSTSMSNEDASYGLSQTQALGDKCDGWVLCFDTKPYYEAVSKIENADAENLRQVKFKGGGATQITSSFETYEKELGKMDLILIITDGAIFDLENLRKLGAPKDTQVVWLITSHQEFKAPFGRVFFLRND